MTVESIYVPVSYHGNGVTVTFAFPFQFFAPSDLIVRLFDLSTNTPVTAPLLNGGAPFDYSVTGTIDDDGTGEYLNGAVTFNTPPPANYRITIERSVAALQSVSLADDSLFPAKSVEAELDRLQMQIQQGQANTLRAITAPVSDGPVNLVLPPAAVRADHVLTFDGAGNVENPGLAVGPIEAAIAAILAGVAPAPTVTGWARTLAAALVLYAAPVLLADGHVVAVDGRFAVNDGYGGIFAYDYGDTVTVFVNSGLGFVDAAGRRFKRIFAGDTILASWFVTGGGDDTAAIVAAAAALQGNGGGKLVFPPRTYRVTATPSAPLFSFANLNGVTIECMEGATIADQQTYIGSDFAELFVFMACRDVYVQLRVTSQVAVSTSAAFARGLRAVVLRQGCTGVRVDLDVVGGVGGLRADKALSDPASYSSRNISGRIVASGCYYPYVGSFAGDNVAIDLDTDTCGRAFFIYGCKNLRFHWACKNLQVTSLIKAYSGQGCEDVRVTLIDRDSTANLNGPRISIQYGDSTPATMRNIAFHLNVKNPSSSPWGNTIGIGKYADGGNLPDTTGRGHLLEGLSVTGVMDSTGCPTHHFNLEDGAFVGPDVQRSIHIYDLTALGFSRAFSVPLTVLSGTALLDNVICEGGLYTSNIAGVAIFDGCVAQNFTNNTAQAWSHHYRACSITDGSLQNYDSNKVFFNTATPNTLRKSGTYVLEAETMLSGDLTVTRNIFRIGSAGTGYRCRLEYYLTADNGDLSGARSETFGVKNFTIFTNSGGFGGFAAAIADEVTQRTLNTAAVPTFAFVAGDANFWHIAFSCTNYASAAARGVFRLSILAAVAYSAAMAD